MSIASQLTALEGNISDAYNMVAQRGGTVPARKNMENLDDAIATIPSGGSFIGIQREVSSQGVYQMPSSSFAFSFPSNATDIGPYAFYYAFINCTALNSADLSSLVAISGERAFTRAFFGCTSLTSVDLSSLTTVSGSYAFQYAFCNSAIASAVFSSLTTVSGDSSFSYAFYGCSSLSSISFPALSNLGSYTNYFNSMLRNCTDVTVHFPAALQSTIGSWTSVQNGFGGTNTTVLFDL